MLVGPLISAHARERMIEALAAARAQGGTVVCGGKQVDGPGYFVEPAIVRAAADMPIVAEETFAPILYVMTYAALDDAIAMQNSVDQGLSSAIFTERLVEAEQFLSPAGSDCGIANVNHRNVGRRDRRRFRRRERYRRRPRSGQRRVESLHAPANLHDQLRREAAAGSRRAFRRRRRGLKSAGAIRRADANRASTRVGAGL